MLDLPFARPSYLYLLAFLLVLGAIGIIAARKRRQRLLIMGRPETVLALSTLRPKTRHRSRILTFAALAVLCLAVAGPRWGKGGNEGVVVGRDLVILLDLSRTMIVPDMREGAQRWEVARAATNEMIETIRARGGHRIAIVGFATHAHVLCPLTSDYDHVQSRLNEFSPAAPPREVRAYPDEPDGITGTAIGAGIHAAISAHDSRFPGYQDILLISDGDGPDVEREIEFGLLEATQRQIPVHAVGVGNPRESTRLEYGEGDEVHLVASKLQEAVLKDIARRTKGEYIPARQESPPLGTWFLQVLEPRPSRELSDDALPQPKDRAVWFLAIGLCLLVFAWVGES